MSNTPIDLQDVVFFLLEEADGELRQEIREYDMYNKIARSLLRHYDAPVSLLDKVVERYLKHVKKGHCFPTPTSILCYCSNLCPHISRDVVEEVIKQMIRFGMYNHAAQAAKDVERTLTSKEVLKLTEKYTNGGSMGSTTDDALLALACASGDQTTVDKVQADLTEMKRRWAIGID